MRTPGLAEGREVYARGRWNRERLAVEELSIRPVVPFSGRVKRLVLEGYVSKDLEGNRFRLGNLEIHISKDTRVEGGKPADLQTNQRIQVRAHIGRSERLIAERIEVERERPERRDSDDGHGSSNSTDIEDDMSESYAAEQDVRDSMESVEDESHRGNEGSEDDLERQESLTRPEEVDRQGSSDGEERMERDAADRPEEVDGRGLESTEAHRAIRGPRPLRAGREIGNCGAGRAGRTTRSVGEGQAGGSRGTGRSP